MYALAHNVVTVEIKAGETMSSSFFSNLRKVRDLFPDRVAGEILVHGAESEILRDGVRVTGPVGFVPVLSDMERDLMS
jgi:hypothetical protein